MSEATAKPAKDTYVVRYTYDLVVKAGDPAIVEEAGKLLQESVPLNSSLKREVVKLDATSAPDTRMRIKVTDGVPMFIRLPLVVDTIEDLAKLEAEPGENAKIKGTTGEGYFYRPDVVSGADGLDLRYTVISRTARGGMWIDVTYMRHMSQEAAR